MRELFITKLRTILSDINPEVEYIVFSDKAMLLKVIFQVRKYRMYETDLMMKKIEAISRGLIQNVYALHHRRCDILIIAGGKGGNVN